MADLEPGSVLGQYTILEPLGEGGMATVYKAYHAALDRNVAIKVLPSRYAADPDFLERFRQEARTVARLRHANILEVYDFGESDGLTYIVNGYMDGGTLATLVGKEASIEAVARIALQIAAGLDHAHSQGVLHRDIKPANVFLSRDGSAVIGDFGLAKILQGGGGLTQAGMVLGTPEYMSPEQALGKTLDARADVYSMSVVLFQLLTGTVPYSAETPLATLLAHVHSPLPAPRVLNASLSEEVEAVLLKGLAKDPNERYAAAGELAKALALACGVAQEAPVYSSYPGILPVPKSGAYPGGAVTPTPTPRSQPSTAASAGALPTVPAATAPVLSSPASAPAPDAGSVPQKPATPPLVPGGSRRSLNPIAVGGALMLVAAIALVAFMTIGRGPVTTPASGPGAPQPSVTVAAIIPPTVASIPTSQASTAAPAAVPPAAPTEEPAAIVEAEPEPTEVPTRLPTAVPTQRPPTAVPPTPLPPTAVPTAAPSVPVGPMGAEDTQPAPAAAPAQDSVPTAAPQPPGVIVAPMGS